MRAKLTGLDEPCVACGREPTDAAHIKSRGSGGKNDKFNLMFLCRTHHRESHDLGWDRFSRRYMAVFAELTNKGWYFDDYSKLKRDK